MIRVDNIFKSFDDQEVLKGVSAEFKSGVTNLIIGRSGSGKTVLIKSILGLHSIDEGEVYFNDIGLSGLSKKDFKKLRKEIGMVFQGGALFDSLTVEENVLLPLNFFSEMSESEKMDRVNTCLKRVNLDHSNKKFPAELSGGMQKRVAIARAISMKPKYLFCDEPNSGLDPGTAIVIDNLIKEITEENNITTVINTHDMNSVLEIGSHVILLKDGYSVWQGNKDEILTTDNKDAVDFVFRSNLFKRVRQALVKDK